MKVCPCRPGDCSKRIRATRSCGRSAHWLLSHLVTAASQISDAVKQAGNASREYDEFVSRTREGEKRHKLVKCIAEIQRQIIALDLHGLFAELDKLTAVESLELRSLDESEMHVTSLAAHIAIYFKTMLFIQGGQTLSSSGADPEKESWHAEIVSVLRRIDLILERHVEMLVFFHNWQDVPLILSVMLNHLVRLLDLNTANAPQVLPCRARPFAETFNRVVQQMVEENEARVERLSILFLTSVEQNVSDSSVRNLLLVERLSDTRKQSRRELIKQMEFWLGSERLKKTGEEVAGQLETSLGLDVGERLKEIFVHTKQSFQAIHKIASNFHLFSDYEETVLKEAFAEKEAGDNFFFDYEKERLRRTQHALYMFVLRSWAETWLAACREDQVGASPPRNASDSLADLHTSNLAAHRDIAAHSPLLRAAKLYLSSFRKAQRAVAVGWPGLERVALLHEAGAAACECRAYDKPAARAPMRVVCIGRHLRSRPRKVRGDFERSQLTLPQPALVGI
eukprot:762538-Hanusia_phi.AAC.4